MAKKENKKPEYVNLTLEAFDIISSCLHRSGQSGNDKIRVLGDEIFKALKGEPGAYTPAPHKQGEFYLQTFTAPGREPINVYLPVEILEGAPPSWPAIKRAYWASFVFAVMAESDTIQFTATQKLLLLGHSKEEIKKNPRLFKQIHDAEMHLAATTFHYKDDKIEVIAHPYSILERKKKGVYMATLSKQFAFGADFKEKGALAKNEFGKPPLYVKIKTDDILQLKGSHYEQTFRAQAYKWHRLPKFQPYGETLLNATGASARKLNRKADRNELLEMVLGVFADQGFEQIKPPDKQPRKKSKYKPSDVRGWKFFFNPPKYANKNYHDITQPEYKEFIEQFMEWYFRPIHWAEGKPELSKEKIKGYLQNMLKAQGLNIIESVFKDINKTSNPHPSVFWREYEDRKRELKAIESQQATLKERLKRTEAEADSWSMEDLMKKKLEGPKGSLSYEMAVKYFEKKKEK